MNKFSIFFISVGIFLLSQTMGVNAGWFGADFSAELVQGTAQKQSVSGKMYVGAGRVRTEMKQKDHSLIEIIDPQKGLAWVLDDGSQVYHERSVPKLSADSDSGSNPCAGMTATTCRRMQDDKVNGRSASKWLLRLEGRDRLQWNDSIHGFPIQVVEAGQLVMAMVFIGEETLNGRRVERWRAMQHNDSGVVENEQWYDPQLNIAIRQVAQDGSFRELRNIQLGPQADALFELPKGYHRQESVAH